MTMTSPFDPMTATLNNQQVDVEILDLEESHDVPGYGEWNCEVTFPDGTTRQGVIWGDEHNYDTTSLELVDEPQSNPGH